MRGTYSLAGALLIGFLLGIASATIYHQRTFKRRYDDLCRTFEQKADRWVLVDFTSSVRENVNTLTAIRRGKIDYLLDLKENALSAGVYDLSLTFPKEVLSTNNTGNLLTVVSRYRAEHPFRTGTEEVDRRVEDLLNLAASWDRKSSVRPRP